MKSFIKVLVFSSISLYFVNYVLNAFNFGSNDSKALFMFILTFTLFNLFVKNILSLVSLPSDGTGFLIINSLLTFVVVYILTVIIPEFTIKSAILPDLNIFGFVLPSKQLNGIGSLVISSLILSFVYTFFDWLSSKK